LWIELVLDRINRRAEITPGLLDLLAKLLRRALGRGV